ncbi:MAG: hypothetical protein WAW06_01695, partial [bacterium]
MRSLKLVVLSIFLAVIAAAGFAFAEEAAPAGTPPGCNATGLDDVLLPSGGIYHVGDVICYEIRLSVDAPACDIQNATVTFWRPDDTPPNPLSVCSSPGGNVIASGLYIAQGAPIIVFDCTTNPAVMSYTVREQDIQPDGTLRAYMCITGTQLVGPPNLPTRDEKESVNFPIRPCIEVTKTVDCDTSRAGDEVVYTIEVCNCDQIAEDSLVSVVDNVMGDLSSSFASVLPAGQCESHEFHYTVLDTDPDPLLNTVTATYVDLLDSVVTDYDDAEVDLVNPDFTVSVVCDSPQPLRPGDTAEYVVCVENTGDVRLDFTVDPPDILPFSLNPGDSSCYLIVVPNAQYPEICTGAIAVTGAIPGYCGLTDQLVRSDSACCDVECPPPCVEIGKTVECDTSKVGDQVVYSICVENC